MVSESKFFFNNIKNKKKFSDFSYCHLAKYDVCDLINFYNLFTEIGLFSKSEIIFQLIKKKINYKYNDIHKFPIKNPNFYEYKKIFINKTLAIVGPSFSSLQNANDINIHDIVLRFNTVNIKNIDSEITGSKCNIVYLNKNYLKKNLILDELFLKDLDLIIIRGNEAYEIFKIKVLNKNLLKKTIIIPGGVNKLFFPHGTVNALQQVLSFLLRFNIKKIKIFNFDFYMNNKIYHSANYSGVNQVGYLVNNESSKILRRFFIRHPLFFNFELVQNLFFQKKIFADKQTEKYLRYSTTNYASIIENIHKPFIDQKS